MLSECSPGASQELRALAAPSKPLWCFVAQDAPRMLLGHSWGGSKDAPGRLVLALDGPEGRQATASLLLHPGVPLRLIRTLSDSPRTFGQLVLLLEHCCCRRGVLGVPSKLESSWRLPGFPWGVPGAP